MSYYRDSTHQGTIQILVPPALEDLHSCHLRRPVMSWQPRQRRIYDSIQIEFF